MKATVLIITALLLSTTLAQARCHNRYDNRAEPRYTTYDARNAEPGMHCIIPTAYSIYGVCWR
jgi:hypothetical protein